MRSFDEKLEKHGKGDGCDICKPTTASILASTWNDHILKAEHAGLQDTNDYYMANMQKDGTYSVVPRMPGGEVTPEGLITVGQVAKKYGLYTKITGGQRVDLFGARVDQLPSIWSELIDAGFESGHAYGKSLRTVKSCVGSTWCRYGVQDSVGTAIDLEKRYRGVRSPHKIKFGVSGCTRECAEARGKDVGVIATGTTSTNCAPNNPNTGTPYFSIPALGWGSGWSTGNVLRFNTVGAEFPVWVVRTVQQGPETVPDDSFTILIRGDVDTP